MLRNYMKVVVRNIIRHKGYSFINILGLAVGMACCIVIMLYVQDEFSYDRYPETPDRIYRIVTNIYSSERGEISTARTPPPWGPVLAKDLPEVENYVRMKTPQVSWMVSYRPGNKKFYEKGWYFADETVFDFFNLKMIQGNPETALKEPSTVVLTESTARKYFGSDDPIGKVLRIDNSFDFTITGIIEDIPQNSHFQCQLLASFATFLTVETGYGLNYGNDMRQAFPDLYTYVRLQEGHTVEGFEQKLAGFIDKYHGEFLNRFNVDMKASLQPLTDIHLRSNREAEIQANSDIAYIYIFSAVALSVLIIACINFMNLATARSAGRAREVGVRKVVGAYRTQLMMQFMGESVFMAILSLIMAIGLVYLLLPLFNALSGKFLALAFTDTGFLLGMAGIVVLVGIIAGSYPALFLSSFHPAAVLKGSSKAGTSSGSTLRKVLVTVQFVISIVFIVGTGVVSDQMTYMQNRNLGFDKEQVVVMSLGDPNQRSIYLRYKNLILQSPAVLAVAGLQSPPGGLLGTIGFIPEGAEEGETMLMDFFGVDHDFIDVLKIELAEGRTFSRDFSTDSTQAFLLNEAAVRQIGWDEPIGKEVRFGPQAPFAPKVIGVVKDFHVKSLHTEIEPLVIAIVTNPVYLAIRIAPGDFGNTLAFLEQEWGTVYPNDPFQYSFLDEDFDNLYQTENLRGQVFSIFSVLTIFIACLGLLGLASFTAEQRTKEIGIRKVMGASVLNITMLLTKDFVKLVVAASIIALPIAYIVMNDWLQNFAYSAGLSPWTFILAALAAVVITVITVSYQAISAALTNPADALQYE